MTPDEAVVGQTGKLVLGTRGAAGPGEVLVQVRGGTETFLAYSDEPLERGATVLVIESRGCRRSWSWPGPTLFSPAARATPAKETYRHVRISRSRARRGDADLGRQAGTWGSAVPRRHRAREVRAPRVPQDPLPVARDERGGSRREVCDQAGHRPDRARRDRLQGRQRPRVDRQRRSALPLRPGPDVGPHRAHLRRSSALDHRLDDGRGDRDRAAEARHGGPRHVEGRDGEDRPARRLAADPVHRRRPDRIHRGDVAPAQGRHPAPGADRAGAGHAGVRRGGAGGGP